MSLKKIGFEFDKIRIKNVYFFKLTEQSSAAFPPQQMLIKQV